MKFSPVLKLLGLLYDRTLLSCEKNKRATNIGRREHYVVHKTSPALAIFDEELIIVTTDCTSLIHITMAA
jgi:hypothetical protein